MTLCINDLPNNDALPEQLAKLEVYVQAIDTRSTTQTQLREALDDLQNKLGELHDRISNNWFLQAVADQS